MPTIKKYIFITLSLLGLLAIINFINIDNPFGYTYMSKFRENPFLSNSYLKAQLPTNDPDIGCSQAVTGTTPLPSFNLGDNSLDADNVLFGTEGGVLIADSANLPPSTLAIQNAINQTLAVKNVKIRLAINSFTSSDGGITYSPSACLPSPTQCFSSFNTDEIAKLFQANNWSMLPMLSFSTDSNPPSMTTADVDKYVNFVDWFVSRYKTNANIKYLELQNYPGGDWGGTPAQLVEAQNKIYNRLKPNFPDLIIGTPGFEYWGDFTNSSMAKALSQVNYFLDPLNDAQFDAWMFHGYALNTQINTPNGVQFISAPPTRTAIVNSYAGIPGINVIRQKLDENGWAGRPIIDAEHTIVYSSTSAISASQDDFWAAYMVQELLLKKTLRTVDSLPSLGGISPLFIASHGSTGMSVFGSLFADGSLTKHVKAVGLLLSKFNEFVYTGHINGQWDNENQVWIEKFDSVNTGNELYIFFKPFRYIVNQNIVLDGQILNYNLTLPQMPASLTLTDINGVVSNPAPSTVITLQAENSPKYLEVAY